MAGVNTLFGTEAGQQIQIHVFQRGDYQIGAQQIGGVGISDGYCAHSRTPR